MWGPATRETKPLARPVQSSDSCKWWWDADSEEDLISLIVEAAATIRQHSGIFERTRQSLLRRCRMCIEVWPHVWISALNWCEIQLFSEYFSGSASIPSLMRPNLTVHNVARTHLRRLLLHNKFVLIPPYHLQKFGHGEFPYPAYYTEKSQKREQWWNVSTIYLETHKQFQDSLHSITVLAFINGPCRSITFWQLA